MNFPLVTWQVPLPEFQVNATSTGPLSNSFGFGLNLVTGEASADSIAGIFAATITAVSGQAASSTYNFSNTTGPSLGPLTYTTTVAGSPVLISFNTLEDAAVFGFDSASFVLVSTTTTVYNPAGMWAPSGVSGDVTRTLKQRAAASSSEMSGLVTDVVNWGEVADIQVQSTLFPAANTFYWYATQAIYAQKAQRNVNDPNNILEKMLAAAATGVLFRIYEEAATAAGFTNTTYLEAKMPQVVTKASAMDVVQADDEPRLWTTTGLFFRGTT